MTVCACMHAPEVTGSDSTRAKKCSFSASLDLGHHNREPTDTAGYGPAATKVSCFKKNGRAEND